MVSTPPSLQFFFPDAILANGTYYEFGTFIGGTINNRHWQHV